MIYTRHCAKSDGHLSFTVDSLMLGKSQLLAEYWQLLVNPGTLDRLIDGSCMTSLFKKTTTKNALPYCAPVVH